MNTLVKVVLLGLVAAMAGCATGFASSPASRAPGPEEALVYVYRLPLISGHLWDTQLSIDGIPRIELNDKEYSQVYVASGLHEFTARFHHEKPLQVRQDLQGGQTYHLELSQEIIGKNRVRHVMQFVPSHTGKDILQHYTYTPAEH